MNIDINLSSLRPDTLAGLYVDMSNDPDYTHGDRYMVGVYLERLVGEDEAEAMVVALGYDLAANAYVPDAWELEEAS